MKKIISVLILSISFTFISSAQPNPGVTDAIRASITDKVNALFSAGMYDPNTIDIVNVDSSITPNEPLGIQDPYNTLKDCYVFLAAGKMQTDGSFPKGFVGVYKDGNIIWHSSPIINSDGAVDAEITPILDMNNDGKVDIVTEWKEGVHGDADYIWIFSWDGSQGTPLNLYDSKGHSNLVSYADEEHYVDLKGNGTLEIQGEWQTNDIPGKDISVLYSWNGQNYVSVDTSSFGSGVVPPRNKVQAVVHASVEEVNDSLYFSYVVENKKNSLQKIENFMLITDKDAITNSVGRQGWDFIKDYYKPRIIWIDMPDLYLLSQGEMDTFVIVTKTDLPGINYFYIQGYNRGSDSDDIYTNSFHGLSISPTSLPSPFVAVSFLDTLISYKHQCVTLGWLTNGGAQRKDKDSIHGKKEKDDNSDEGGIVERLDRRLDNAKDALSKNDSIKARQELEQFVKEVEHAYHQNKEEGKREGVPVLTSEGYALLKYNAEYLIDRLPNKREGE